MEALRRLRNEAGLTQGQLAEKVGLSLNTILNYEKGRRDPRKGDMEKLALFFGCSLDDLANFPRTSGSKVQEAAQVAAALSE